jgi:hypothetical protein
MDQLEIRRKLSIVLASWPTVVAVLCPESDHAESGKRVGCLLKEGSHVPQDPAPGSMTIPTSPSSSVQRNPPFTIFAEKLPPLANAQKIEVLDMAEYQRSSAIRREALDAERQTEVLKA